MTSIADVTLWGTTIAAVSIPDGGAVATFQYDPAFLASHVQVAPLTMPLRAEPYSFPSLAHDTFQGLPGFLADSLPDRYGHALINAWLATQGRSAESFTAIERLCYIGSRGMGAIEFSPTEGPQPRPGQELQIAALVELASEVLSDRRRLVASLAGGHRRQAMQEILSVGTSAGGARAKAVIAFNPESQIVRSGQLALDPGFDHWLLKFDGVANNRDHDSLGDPEGFGALEYAYSLMCAELEITMTECRLLEEGGRRHFMTRRFDRVAGDRLHVQSLGALAHLDFNQPGANSYEQAFDVTRRLGLPQAAREQLFRRMVFNVVARNQDDHVKNIAFLMDRTGTWSLAPAYDMAWSYRPGGWTAQHQMSLNGKRDDFTLSDFTAVGQVASLPRGRARRIVADTAAVVADWPRFAEQANVDESLQDSVADTVRLSFPDR